MQALRLHYTSQAEAALRTALPQLQAVRTFRTGTTVSSAVFDPVDANEVASADRRHRLDLGRQDRPPPGAHVAERLQRHRRCRRCGLQPDRHRGRSGLRGRHGGLVRRGQRKETAVDQLSVADCQRCELHRQHRRSWPSRRRTVSPCGSPRDGFTSCPTRRRTRSPSTRGNPLKLVAATANGAVIWNMRASRAELPNTRVCERRRVQPRRQRGRDCCQLRICTYLRPLHPQGVVALDAGEGAANSAAFSPDGKLVVAGYKSGTTRVWDVSTGFQLTSLAGNASEVHGTVQPRRQRSRDGKR